MSDEAQRLLSIFSNAFGAPWDVLAIFLVLTLFATRWKSLEMTSKLFGIGLLFSSVGHIFRVSWWGPALFLARPGTAYHPIFIQERWLSYSVGGSALVIGLTLILHQVFPRYKMLIWLTFAFSLAFAGTVTWAFHLSEIGWWDRTPLIDWFDQCCPHEEKFERVIIRDD